MPALTASSGDSVRDLDFDPLLELREASATPTPLSSMLQDASILRSLIGHKKSRRGSTSSQRSGSRERVKDPRRQKKDSDTESILTLVLAEEERQAHHLKAVLRSTGERLEAEMRRADQAEERARAAENRAREATSKATTAESARHLAELDATRAREEIARYRLIAESAERELRKAEADVQRLERSKADVEQSAADARDTARKAQQALREWQAREEGRAEGLRVQVQRHYDQGREDGLEDGRAEGYEAGRAEGLEEGRAEGMHAGRSEGLAAGRLSGFDEGRQVGYDEGYNAGYNQGRKDERVKALEAFDKFIDRELDKEEALERGAEGHKHRTYRWVEETRQAFEEPETRHSRAPSPKPIRPPSPRVAREPSPLPVPWLHRQPRMATPPAPIIYSPAPPAIPVPPPGQI